MDVADEVGVAGGVDEVDLVVIPLERSHRQRHRHAALVLFGVVVEQRRAVIDASLPVDCAGAIEQRFGEGRLARPVVADEDDVANLLRRVDLHVLSLQDFAIESRRLVMFPSRFRCG